MADAIQTSRRDDAARINPFISFTNKNDTLTQCACALDSLGHLIATSESPDKFLMGHIHLFTGAISSALMFESGVSHV